MCMLCKKETTEDLCSECKEYIDYVYDSEQERLNN